MTKKLKDFEKYFSMKFILHQMILFQKQWEIITYFTYKICSKNQNIFVTILICKVIDCTVLNWLLNMKLYYIRIKMEIWKEKVVANFLSFLKKKQIPICQNPSVFSLFCSDLFRCLSPVEDPNDRQEDCSFCFLTMITNYLN